MRSERRRIWIVLLFAGLLTLLAFVSVGCTSTGVTHYVNPGESIQAAVNAAFDGDTIIVHDGTYTENVNVNKRLTIQSENSSANCIVQAANPEDHVFEVTTDYVNINGFMVKNATGSWKAGIYLKDFVDHCTIANNVVLNNRYGILPWYATDNIITENTFIDNNCGIYLYASSGNTITGNIFEHDGILIMGWQLTHYNTHVIENNAVNGKPLYYYKNAHGLTVPDDAGEVILANCSDMLVKDLNISSGATGIQLAFTTDSEVSNSTINSHSFYGIFLAYSTNNTISNNDVTDSYCGITLHSSSKYNLVTENSITANSYSGIYLYSSSNSNTIKGNNLNLNGYGILSWSSNSNHLYHNNFVDNTNQASDNTGTNTWDAEFPAGGNYWSDYIEKYPSAGEINESGIWNTPYDIAGGAGAVDGYPLLDPWAENLTIIINEPSSYAAYPKGSNLPLNVSVYKNGRPLTSTEITVEAHLLSPAGIESEIALEQLNSYNLIGEFYLSFNYPKGFWSVRFEANDTEGNTVSAEVNILVTESYRIQAAADRTAYTINDTISLTARVLNVRPLKALNDSEVNVTLSIFAENDTSLYDVPLTSDITDNFKYNITAEQLGNGWFQARFDVMDRSSKIVNKTISFVVTDDYFVTVNTDRATYDMGTPINIKGGVRFISGTGVANATVELRIDVKGYFRLFSVTTNETGEFSFLFEPFSHEAGNYTLEAKVVRDRLVRLATSNFTIHGLYMSPETASFMMTENQSMAMNISLRNIGETELTGLNISMIDHNTSDDVTVELRLDTLPSNLSPGEEALFKVTVTSGQRNVREYEVKLFNISATTDQASPETTLLEIELYPLAPIVDVWPQEIKMGLRRNDTALKIVTITNTGFSSLKNVTLIMQPTLPGTSIISPTLPDDLAPGEDMSVDIYIAPADVAVGIYRQNMTMMSDNYENVTINVTMHVTDLNNGSLSFHIKDILGDNVNNATVSLLAQGDSAELKEYTAITNDEGHALLDGLPIGRYSYWIEPSDSVHFPQPGIVEVEPLFDHKVIDITLDMHFVEFSWDVIYTPILDSYQLLLNYTFETDVPVPVLAAYPPLIYHEIEQNETKSSSLKLVNHGLVSLFNVTLTQPISRGGISLEFQETDIGEIKAKKGVVVPYKISATPTALDCQVFRGDIEAVGDFIFFVDGKEKIGKAGTRIPYIIKTPCSPDEGVSEPFPPGPPIECPAISVSPEVITLEEYFGCTPEDTYQIIDPILVSNEDEEPVYLGPVLGYTKINDSGNYTMLKLLDEVDSVLFGYFNPDMLDPGNESIANLTDIPTTFPFTLDLLNPGENVSAEFNVSGYVAFSYGYDFPICPHIIPATGVRVFEICPPDFVLPIPSDISIIMPGWAWVGGRGHEYYGNPPGPFIYTHHIQSPDPPSQPTVFGNTIHELVKFSISQNATLERDAFTARLGIFNRMRLTNVTNIDIQLHFTDTNGTDARDMFHVMTPQLTGIENITGSGIIGPQSIANMQWLIIPKIGAGGIDSSGITYNISAEINYAVNAQNFSYQTRGAGIRVKPQPNLTLAYYIPAEVYANRPFKLAIKVCNRGYGIARHFAIDSAQPEIYYNPSGLLVNFSLRNSSLNGTPMGSSLKIDFGDIYPAQCKFAWWEMVSTLDGDFTNFTGSYTHVDALGGRETALITNISTYIIQREIQAGYDANISFDFLVGDSCGGIPKWVIDSMYGNDTEVVNVSYHIVMWDGKDMVMETEKVVNKWIVASIEDPNENKVPILKIVRHDSNGTVEIPQFNYWMRDGRILIVDDPVTEYTILFDLTGVYFDTAEGTYPSISGTFTGTITPSRNLTVGTLYTYSCPGTGGHTKSVQLYEDGTLLASGVWDGYQGDWHNITLVPDITTLVKDHEYRYVIETGSYPQIIHAESKEVAGGRITCEEFIDLNGKRHEDWIPAIRLE